ncbi:MAG: phenylalanine 4-monooxygenase [Sphingomonadales bacterium]
MLQEPIKAGGQDAASPPEGAAADWTIPQRWERFTPEEHRTWDILFARQQEMLAGRAVEAFRDSLDVLKLSRPGIPNFDELSERLNAATGWSVVAVPGLVPDDVFHHHLAQRRFPAGNFIRSPEQLGYLQEPDVFHDVFGHIPLLAIPEWADFMQAMGELGLQALEHDSIHRLARLYWYTVEFGLSRENGQLRIYGAGIVSSFNESRYALESPKPNRIEFDLKRVLSTNYKIDDFQQTYFVIDRFRDLLNIVLKADLPALYAELEGTKDHKPSDVLPGDRLVS